MTTTRAIPSTCCGSPRGAVGASVADRPATGFAAGLVRIFDTLIAWQQRAADRRALQAMDTHLLRDIGLSRADIDAEASKPFWRD